MDITELEKYFKNMTPQERQKIISKLNAFNIATDINQNREFQYEAFQEIFQEYPFLKEYLDCNYKDKSIADFKRYR